MDYVWSILIFASAIIVLPLVLGFCCGVFEELRRFFNPRSKFRIVCRDDDE